MDLDVISDGDLQKHFFSESRREILRGLDPEKDWRQLQSRHSFFTDVVADARKQALLLAPAMAATEYFLGRICLFCENASQTTFADVIEVKAWRVSFSIFLSLYASSPVPTRNRWINEMHQRGLDTSTDDGGGFNVGGAKYDSSGACDEDEDDDGSFVEKELKDLVRRCVILGRKWCRVLRTTNETGEDVDKIRRAVSVMDVFITPKTLDW